jgi:hypothetical protein
MPEVLGLEFVMREGSQRPDRVERGKIGRLTRQIAIENGPYPQVEIRRKRVRLVLPIVLQALPEHRHVVGDEAGALPKVFPTDAKGMRDRV